MGVYKKFSEQLYKDHNDVAINKVLSVLLNDELYAVRNDDLYGPDIVVFSGFRPGYYLEVEHRNGWKTGPFPWPLVNIPERKGKFLKAGLPLEFWVLSHDITRAIIVKDTCLTADKLYEVPNKQVSSGEYFYRIPLEECDEIEI